MDGDHFDGGDGCLEALVSGFEASTVEGLFEGFAGEDAEGVGDAGLLLGLSDTSGDFVVDGFVVGSFSAEEAAEGYDGIEFFGLGEGAGGGGNLPGTGDADDFYVGFGGAAAVKGVQRSLQEAIGDDGVPAGGDDGEAHAGGAEVPFDGYRLVMEGVLRLPEAEGQVFVEFDGEEAGVPMGELGCGQERRNLFGAMAGEHPLVDGRVNVVELGGFDEDGGHGGCAAGDELQVADGGEEGCTTACGVVPAFADLEAEGLEETAELVQFATGRGACGDCVDEGNSLDHRFDCIVCNRRTLRWNAAGERFRPGSV